MNPSCMHTCLCAVAPLRMSVCSIGWQVPGARSHNGESDMQAAFLGASGGPMPSATICHSRMAGPDFGRSPRAERTFPAIAVARGRPNKSVQAMVYAHTPHTAHIPRPPPYLPLVRTDQRKHRLGSSCSEASRARTFQSRWHRSPGNRHAPPEAVAAASASTSSRCRE